MRSRKHLRNNGLISLTSLPGKVLEHIFLQTISCYLKDKKVISNRQPESTIYKHCLINVIVTSLAGDDKLRDLDGGLNCRVLIQSEVEKLEAWAKRNLTKFSKKKCKVLPLGQNNPIIVTTGWEVAGSVAFSWKGPGGCSGCGVVLQSYYIYTKIKISLSPLFMKYRRELIMAWVISMWKMLIWYLTFFSFPVNFSCHWTSQ